MFVRSLCEIIPYKSLLFVLTTLFPSPHSPSFNFSGNFFLFSSLRCSKCTLSRSYIYHLVIFPTVNPCGLFLSTLFQGTSFEITFRFFLSSCQFISSCPQSYSLYLSLNLDVFFFQSHIGYISYLIFHIKPSITSEVIECMHQSIQFTLFKITTLNSGKKETNQFEREHDDHLKNKHWHKVKWLQYFTTRTQLFSKNVNFFFQF